MSSTVFNAFKLFAMEASHPLLLEAINGCEDHQDLFAGESSVIFFLFEESRCSNVYPHNWSWKLSFVGTEQQLNRYVNYMTYLFDDGLNKARFIRNGKAWRSCFQRLQNNVSQISLSDFHGIKFHGCSFPTNIVEQDSRLRKIIYEKGELVYSKFSELRSVIKLEAEDDIQRMAAASIITTHMQNLKDFTYRPWGMSESEAAMTKWLPRPNNNQLIA